MMSLLSKKRRDVGVLLEEFGKIGIESEGLAQRCLGGRSLIRGRVKARELIEGNALHDRWHLSLHHVLGPGFLELRCMQHIVAIKVELREILLRMPVPVAQNATPQRFPCGTMPSSPSSRGNQ